MEQVYKMLLAAAGPLISCGLDNWWEVVLD
jgi:hypothetical protein